MALYSQFDNIRLFNILSMFMIRQYTDADYLTIYYAYLR